MKGIYFCRCPLGVSPLACPPAGVLLIPANRLLDLLPAFLSLILVTLQTPLTSPTSSIPNRSCSCLAFHLLFDGLSPGASKSNQCKCRLFLFRGCDLTRLSLERPPGTADIKSKLSPFSLSLSNSDSPFFLSVFSAASQHAAPGCLQGRVSKITPSLFVILFFSFVFFF